LIRKLAFTLHVCRSLFIVKGYLNSRFGQSVLLRMSSSKPFTPLPQNVVPILYKLKFQPNLDEFTFSGTESINVEVKEATENIVLNSKNLKIDQVSFVDFKNGMSFSRLFKLN